MVDFHCYRTRDRIRSVEPLSEYPEGMRALELGEVVAWARGSLGDRDWYWKPPKVYGYTTGIWDHFYASRAADVRPYLSNPPADLEDDEVLILVMNDLD